MGTITDNDPAPTLSVNDVSVTEGNAGTTTATFTVSLSAASGNAVTFDWATAAGTATAGADYVTASGSATIAAGATTTTVGITVNGDIVDENNETFTVNLSNPPTPRSPTARGGTITDDDAAPTLSIDDVAVAEGNGGTTTATFTVSLSAASGQTVTVDWATADGTAAAGADYARPAAAARSRPGATTRHGRRHRQRRPDRRGERDLHRRPRPTPATPRSPTARAPARSPTTTRAPSLSIDDVTVTEGNAGHHDGHVHRHALAQRAGRP